MEIVADVELVTVTVSQKRDINTLVFTLDLARQTRILRLVSNYGQREATPTLVARFIIGSCPPAYFLGIPATYLLLTNNLLAKYKSRVEVSIEHASKFPLCESSVGERASFLGSARRQLCDE